jgi:indolepyruvate ferredoxin oxidoreductase
MKSILRAIEANGTSVESNKKAFELGRIAAHDPSAVAAEPRSSSSHEPETLAKKIGRLAAELSLYQNDAYAARYLHLVEAVREAENTVMPGRSWPAPWQ